MGKECDFEDSCKNVGTCKCEYCTRSFFLEEPWDYFEEIDAEEQTEVGVKG